MRPTRLTLTVITVYVLSAFALPGAPRALVEFVVYQKTLVLATFGVFPLALGVFAWRIRAGGSFVPGWRNGLRLARADGWFTERVAWFIGVVVLVPIFFWAFAAWKTGVAPFTWDARLAALDMALHGTRPHRWLPLTPRMVRAMSLWYWSWNYLLLAVILWQGWCGSRRERARFWLAFVLTWTGLGTMLAHVVASAGPVFYLRATGDSEPYHRLRAVLTGADQLYDLRLIGIQRYLWEAVSHHAVVFGGGISAFPSLHVAMPTLAACAAWRVSRGLAAGLFAYALVTLVCAVGLGWHYAVDGYASLLLVPVVWRASGRVSRRETES